MTTVNTSSVINDNNNEYNDTTNALFRGKSSDITSVQVSANLNLSSSEGNRRIRNLRKTLLLMNTLENVGDRAIDFIAKRRKIIQTNRYKENQIKEREKQINQEKRLKIDDTHIDEEAEQINGLKVANLNDNTIKNTYT